MSKELNGPGERLAAFDGILCRAPCHRSAFACFGAAQMFTTDC